jgi:4-hydroxy-3-methylbut-2-en-1-yl diphosphate reductase
VSAARRPTLLVAAPLAIEAFAVRAGVPGLRVVRTGMGPRRSERAAARLATEPAGAFAVAGVCGALRDDCEPGDLIVASALLGPGGERIEVDASALVAALERAGLPVHEGVIASVAQPANGGRRAELARTGARAVDMESFWLARAAAGRPFAVLRVVTDGPRHELWRPGIVPRGIKALRRLRAAAPVLVAWAAAASATSPTASSTPSSVTALRCAVA